MCTDSVDVIPSSPFDILHCGLRLAFVNAHWPNSSFFAPPLLCCYRRTRTSPLLSFLCPITLFSLSFSLFSLGRLLPPRKNDTNAIVRAREVGASKLLAHTSHSITSALSVRTSVRIRSPNLNFVRVVVVWVFVFDSCRLGTVIVFCLVLELKIVPHHTTRLGSCLPSDYGGSVIFRSSNVQPVVLYLFSLSNITYVCYLFKNRTFYD